MRRTFLIAVLGILLLAPSAFAGSVTGKVTYDGNVPRLRPIDMNADPACAAKHDSRVANPMLTLGEGNGMANIFVQIKNAPAGGTAPTEPVEIDPTGCLYEPRVAGAMVGQPVLFKNSDGILHNVHGLPEENREFNIGMPPTLKEKEQTFNKPEPLFPVKCDVHPWMQSYVAVMTHPYFTTTDANGNFTIDGVPAGTYEVEVWHERLGTQSMSVTVGDGAAEANFSLSPPSR